LGLALFSGSQNFCTFAIVFKQSSGLFANKWSDVTM